MIVYRRIQQATRSQTPILLTGFQMGGGPSAWAADAHARPGLRVFATPDAATTINDELDLAKASGVILVSEVEAARLPSACVRIQLRDSRFPSTAESFAR